ncbi:MAG TPA: ZIP family metal transporter [Chloroflexi bacterium]|jgi:ZIP family zinc transporter|nr:ZIP family metal transporter [Chloroflexota bacterium]
MVAFFESLSPFLQALIATLFTWGMTALGAAAVFLGKAISRKVLDGMMGFASGVMIAASFFSLLAPAVEMSEGGPVPVWVPAVVGFLLGGGFLYIIDKLLPHMHPGQKTPEGIKSHFQRSVLLVLAITLHNIPEGLAVGVGFGAAALGLESASTSAAIALALGIGIQNFPEGMAVSMPLAKDKMKRGKAFFYGQLSGIVEPIAAILGVLAVTLMRNMLPYALSFAAGAMIYVVAEELIPESKRSAANGHSDVPTIGVMLGFALMMLLDVALG